MAFRTIAVEAALARGWSRAELARRTHKSLKTVWSWEHGSQPGPKSIEAIMDVFPDLPYERLFVPVDSSALKSGTTRVEPPMAETSGEGVAA